MKPSVLAAIIVVVLVAIGSGVFIVSREDEDTTQTRTTPTTNEQRTTTIDTSENVVTSADASSELASPITIEQVALHNSEEDCWTIIDGVVYDITSYIPRHPGGSNILSACGVDSTEFFKGEKSGQAGGSNDHSDDSRALSALAALKIGDLAQ